MVELRFLHFGMSGAISNLFVCLSCIPAIDTPRLKAGRWRQSMEGKDEKVGNLKKVTVLFEAGTRPETMDLTHEPIPYEFIYGVGTHGLSPFEFELANKAGGDEMVLPMSKGEMSDFFCHHFIPQLAIPEGGEGFYLRMRIVGVSAPDQREVIKAMAEAAACGGGCCGH